MAKPIAPVLNVSTADIEKQAAERRAYLKGADTKFSDSMANDPNWKCVSIYLPTEVVESLKEMAAEDQFRPLGRQNLALFMRSKFIDAVRDWKASK